MTSTKVLKHEEHEAKLHRAARWEPWLPRAGGYMGGGGGPFCLGLGAGCQGMKGGGGSSRALATSDVLESLLLNAGGGG
jgi:hypothetical protein